MKKLLLGLLLIPSLVFGQATGMVISNKPAGGAIGTAAATVDIATLFNLNQTTAGQTLTIPNLTNASAGKIIYVNAVGSATLTLSPGGFLIPGKGVILRWTGAAWNVCANGHASLNPTSTYYPVNSSGIFIDSWLYQDGNNIEITNSKKIQSANGNSFLDFDSGNSLTIGSYGNKPFIIKVNNEQAGRIDTAGGGLDNTFYGYQSGNSITNGQWNVGIGKWALKANTTGTANTAVGLDALYSNTTGASNVAVGEDAMLSTISGGNNVAIGVNALYTNTISSNNTAIGTSALRNLDGAAGVTGVGYNVLFNNSTGQYNTAVGSGAGVGVSTASENSYFGADAGVVGNSARNTGIGAYTLSGGTNTGGNNTTVGYQGMYGLTSGSENTGMGAYSLRSNTTGNQNSACGMFGGYANTTGSNNLFLGYYAGRYQSAPSGKIYIGTRDYGTSAAENQLSPVVISSHATDSTQTTINLNGVIRNSTATASTVASFDASKNIVGLSTATYPSLTELSYVKGVTSAIQTQINTKLAKTDTAIFNASDFNQSGHNITIDYTNGQAASAVNPGFVTTGSQTFAGVKTFTNPIVGTQSPNDNSTKAASTAYVDAGESGFTLSFIITNTAVNPADATTYYFGILFNALQSTANIRTLQVPINCTLVGYTINIANAAGASNESSSMYARLNNTTDITLSTSIDHSSTSYHVSGTLSQAITANDLLEIKFITPTWATNPTGLLGNVVLRFK